MMNQQHAGARTEPKPRAPKKRDSAEEAKRARTRRQEKLRRIAEEIRVEDAEIAKQQQKEEER